MWMIFLEFLAHLGVHLGVEEAIGAENYNSDIDGGLLDNRQFYDLFGHCRVPSQVPPDCRSVV